MRPIQAATSVGKLHMMRMLLVVGDDAETCDRLTLFIVASRKSKAKGKGGSVQPLPGPLSLNSSH